MEIHALKLMLRERMEGETFPIDTARIMGDVEAMVREHELDLSGEVISSLTGNAIRNLLWELNYADERRQEDSLVHYQATSVVQC